MDEELLTHWARHYFNSSVLVKNPLDPIYAASGSPTPPVGGMFSGASIPYDQVAGVIDTPATTWALINMCRIYKLANYLPARTEIDSIADYLVTHIIDCDFYGSAFKAMPNSYSYLNGAYVAKTNIIHLRTFYHTAWALLEAYDITRNNAYRVAAESLLDGAATFFSNIKDRVNGLEISSWMDGAVYNALTSGDGYSFEPSWTDFANTTIDVINYAVTKYLQLLGDAARTGAEGTPYNVSDLRDKHAAWFRNAYDNHGMRNTSGKLLYCFYHFDWGDPTDGNGTYTPVAQNWDFVNDIWGQTQWFTGDLVFWALNGMASSGMELEATELANEYYAIRTYVTSPDETLFYDRYNSDGTPLVDDDSISIAFTALFYKLCNRLGITVYNSRVISTLKTYMRSSASSVIDGGFSWDVKALDQNLESKTLGEIVDATADVFSIISNTTVVSASKNISVYSKDTTNFNNNGLVVLSDAISCLITEELNGLFELELTYPIDKRGKWQHLVEDNIIKADGQLFRIYHKKKNLTAIKVNARHIFYDLLDNFLEDVRPTNQTGSGALDWVLTHTQYPHSFTNMSDVGGYDTKYYVRKNPVEAIMGEEGIISIWGGELVRDNYIIKLLGARGLDRGVLISYGKNIQGIEETLSTEGLCTRLMPLGKDALMLPEKYIDSQYIDNYPHPKIKPWEFSDIGVDAELGITEAMAIVLLRAAATSYMVDGKIDIPTFNYAINFLELSKTEEYKNYAALERVYLGDTVTVRHSKLGIDLKAKVIKTTKNVLTGRLEKVELGSFKPNIATGIDNAIQDVIKVIENDKSQWQKAVDNATNLINSSLGGFVVKRAGEILIMDTEDINTAVKVWRWNLNGLGYSSTGYAGPFALAMTMDGRIVASFISGLLGEFVQIRASQIILGTDNGKIPDGLIAGSSGWNVAAIKAANALISANNALILAENALQQNIGYNNTYISQNGVQVRDLFGAEVVTMGALGYGLYGLKVKNATAAEVVLMGKVASGVYGIKAFHSDGSFTQLTQNGLERYVNGELKSYHFETYVLAGTTQHPTGYGDLDKMTIYGEPMPTYYANGRTIQLPARFKGKDFSAFIVYKSGVMVYQYAKGTTYVEFEVTNIDKANARVTVVGYATCYWSSDGHGDYWDWQNEYIHTFSNDWNERRTTGFEYTLIVTL